MSIQPLRARRGVLPLALVGLLFLGLGGGSGARAAVGSPWPLCPQDFTSLGDFTAAGTVVFDTSALTFGGAAGGVDAGGVAVYCFDDVVVPAGTTVVGVGSRPLAILAQRTMTVDGTIHVNGTDAVATFNGPNPGGAGGGEGGRALSPVANSGGGVGGGAGANGSSGAGGGGFGGNGGNGGGPGQAGGLAYGDLTLGMDGGSGGGGGEEWTGGAGVEAGGGGGGGGLYLAAIGDIRISGSGRVRANGGFGNVANTGASGGGSGGGIVLFAPVVTNDGAVEANGGAGGPGGCCGSGGGGGGGRILVSAQATGVGAYSVAGGSGSGSGQASSPGAAGVLEVDPFALPACWFVLTGPTPDPDVEANQPGCAWAGTLSGFQVVAPPGVTYPADLTVTVDFYAPVVLPGYLTADGPFDLTFGGASPLPALDGLGSHQVEIVARNADGVEGYLRAVVNVVDTTAPVLTGGVGKTLIWSPAGGLFDVLLDATTTDVCDPGIVTLTVWSDEPVGAIGPDAVFGNGVLRLRAERLLGGVGNGRVYVLELRAEDFRGNVSTACFTVVVPVNLTVSRMLAVRAEAATYCGAPPPHQVLPPTVVSGNPIPN